MTFSGLQQHLTGECLTDVVTNCHVGNEKSLPSRSLRERTGQGLAHWQKLRIFLDIRNETEHLLCPVMYPPDGRIRAAFPVLGPCRDSFHARLSASRNRRQRDAMNVASADSMQLL